MKNKKAIIAGIVTLSLLAILIIVFLIFMLNGKYKFNRLFKNINKISENLIYEKEFENTFDLIDVEMTIGDIEIKATKEEKIKVLVYSDDGNVDVDNSNLLKIKVNSNECHGFCFNIKKDKIIIYLPENYSNQIETLNDYGDTTIDDFEDSIISVVSKCGDVVITSANKVKVQNDYGDIEIKRSKEVDIKEDCGKVVIGKTSNAKIKNNYGDIEIDIIEEGFVDLQNDCGDIAINNLNIIEDSYIKDDFGSIEIGNTNEIYIDASTDLGSIDINNNYRSKEIILEIKNNCGDIEVNN